MAVSKTSHLRCLHTLDRTCRPHCVVEQAGDCHGAYSAGDGGDRSGDFCAAFEITVAHQNVFAVAFDAVDAHVDDGGAQLEPVAFDHFRAADGGDDQVGLAHDGWQVF